MSAPCPIFQEVFQRIRTTAAPRQLPYAACCRLALLVTGILAAKSSVLAQIAAELDALRLTRASTADSIARRLRRTLNDPHLTPAVCYTPVLEEVIDWPHLLAGSRRVVLVIDESSKADEIHLLRVSLPYWGGSLPLAWSVWEQNVPLPAGEYWRQVDAVLASVARLVPPNLEVIVVADEFFAIPPFVDRLHAYGWHWAIRITPNGSHRFRDQQGRETRLGARVRQQLRQPGQRWKGRGEVFKDAGWYPASIVAVWALGTDEPLVVLSDLPPCWSVLRHYDRRFWTEPGFRNDKRKGWQWEDSQVQGVEHHARLLLGMAWATLVTLCLGVEAARARLAAEAARPVDAGRQPGRPRHARESVFTLGLRQLRAWLYRTWHQALTWHLPEVDSASWSDRWHQQQAHRLIFSLPVRP